MYSNRYISAYHLNSLLCFLFFGSGCSALIYQIMWERMIFSFFGTDLVSITIIVSVFMFGLGIGGLIGGVVGDSLRNGLLYLYTAIEFLIGIFGWMSPAIITTIGSLTSGSNRIVIGLCSFLILGFPTLLMGATFPILVLHVNFIDRQVGHSVGRLYFANTLGGAVGALLSGFLLLYCMQVTDAIHLAALLNFLIAMIAFSLLWRKR